MDAVSQDRGKKWNFAKDPSRDISDVIHLIMRSAHADPRPDIEGICEGNALKLSGWVRYIAYDRQSKGNIQVELDCSEGEGREHLKDGRTIIHRPLAKVEMSALSGAHLENIKIGDKVCIRGELKVNSLYWTRVRSPEQPVELRLYLDNAQYYTEQAKGCRILTVLAGVAVLGAGLLSQKCDGIRQSLPEDFQLRFPPSAESR